MKFYYILIQFSYILIKFELHVDFLFLCGYLFCFVVEEC